MRVPAPLLLATKAGKANCQIPKTRKARLERLRILQEIEMPAGRPQVPRREYAERGYNQSLMADNSSLGNYRFRSEAVLGEAVGSDVAVVSGGALV